MTGAQDDDVDHDDVDTVLAALADPTRRAIFEMVIRSGPVTATALAGDLPVSRQAVTKHLERLARAALVTCERSGRETRWAASPAPLGTTRAWLDEVGAAWDRRLQALSQRLDEQHADRGSSSRDATDRTHR